MSRQVVYCVGIIIYLYLLLSLLLLTLELKFNLNEVGSVKIGSPFDQVTKIAGLINTKLFMILTLHFVDYLKRCECGNLSDALGITYNLICLNLHKPVYNVACKLLRSLNKCLPFLILIHVHLLNLNMITIVNPSVKNPGPKQISVLYSNIQGLINTRDLASDQPPLNMTKIHEIGGYLISHKPDIVILGGV